MKKEILLVIMILAVAAFVGAQDLPSAGAPVGAAPATELEPKAPAGIDPDTPAARPDPDLASSDDVIEFLEPEAEAEATITAVADDEDLISITVDDVPLEDVVRMFTKLSNANIIATPSNLAGTVTVSLSDVEWRPALSSILEMHNLALVEKTPGSDIWTIVPRAADAAEPMHVQVIKLKYATVADTAHVVRDMTSAEGGTVSEFPSRNTIVMRATASTIEEVLLLIDEIDIPRDQVYIEAKFVEIIYGQGEDIGVDWKMLEGYRIGLGGITRSYSDARTTERSETETSRRLHEESRLDEIASQFDMFNVQFEDSASTFLESPPFSENYVQEITVEPTRNMTDTLNDELAIERATADIVTRTIEDVRTAVLSASDLEIVISALKQMNGVSIISNPKIIVANGEKAKIHIGESEPNIKGTVTPGQEGQANTTTYELDPTQPYFRFGIELDVVPTVNTESNITVEILPKITRFIRNKIAPDGISYPITAEKEIRTLFSLANGKTAAIGGLTKTEDRDTRKSIPFLGAIPLLGKYLFSHKSMQTEQEETIIFVTVGLANPDIMDPDVGYPEYAEETRKQLIRRQVRKREYHKELDELQSVADRATRYDQVRDQLRK
jgi:type II secretory pathway component GspD/PulD (secretin)